MTALLLAILAQAPVPSPVIANPLPSSVVLESAAVTGYYRGRPARTLHILGRRSQGWTATNVLGDCVQYLDTTQAAHNHPDTSARYYLQSSSASDTSDGTGARTVRVVSVMSDGGQQAAEFTLAGTSAVDAGTDYKWIQWMEVSSVGTGKVSAGNITFSSAPASPDAGNIVEYIATGGNRSLSGHYMVPLNKSAYILGWDAVSIGNATMDVRLRAESNADNDAFSNVYHFKDTAFLTAGQQATHDTPWLKVPGLAEIKISATPSNAAQGNRLDCSFTLLLVDD